MFGGSEEEGEGEKLRKAPYAGHVDFEVDLDAAVRAETLHFAQVCDAPDLFLTVSTLGSEIWERWYLQGPGLSI